MGKRECRTMDEDDVQSGYYKLYCPNTQRRMKRDVKRSTRRRERRNWKANKGEQS